MDMTILLYIVQSKLVHVKTWKRMLIARASVEGNSQILHRDGRNSFWFENWLGTGPLAQNKLQLPNPNVTISELFQDGVWSLEPA